MQKIPIDRILVLNPEPFTPDDFASGFFRGKNRLDNNILAGSRQAWIDYVRLYDEVMSNKLKINAFIGDDWLLLHYMVIFRPMKFCFVREPSLITYLSDESFVETK